MKIIIIKISKIITNSLDLIKVDNHWINLKRKIVVDEVRILTFLANSIN